MALHVNHEFTKYSVGGPVGGRRWELQPAVQEDRAAGAGTARPCAAAGDRRGGGTAPQGGRLGPVGERRRELQPTGARARGGSTMRPWGTQEVKMATGTRNPLTRRVLPDKKAGVELILYRWIC
jgi:hypothetical protein